MEETEGSALSMPPPEAPLQNEAIRYSKDEWDIQRPVIKQMYRSQGSTLKEIVAFLKDHRAFVATERQLKRKIKDWKLDKNVKLAEMKVIVAKKQQRAAIGKSTTFRVRGQPVTPAKIDRWQKRSGEVKSRAETATAPNSPTLSTPSDISYNTGSDKALSESALSERALSDKAISDRGSLSPSQRNIHSMAGGDLGPGRSPLPPPFPPPENHNITRLPQDTYSNRGIESMLIMGCDNFEGQSPAPFTVPSSPAPPPSTALTISQNPLEDAWPLPQTLDLSNLFTSSQDPPQMMWEATFPAGTGPQPAQVAQKSRYRQNEEFELAKRLADLRSKHGSDHRATVDTIYRLADIYKEQGRYQSAELFYRQVGESLQKTTGENDPKTLEAFNFLSQVFLLQGRFSTAERLARLVCSKASEVLDPSDRRLLRMRNCFASCLHNLGRHAEAEQILRDVIKVGSGAHSPESHVMLESKKQFAQFLIDQGIVNEAHKTLLELDHVHTLVRPGGSDIRFAFQARMRLGEVCNWKGESQQAEKIVREIFDAQNRLLGPEHANTLRTKLHLALSLTLLGRLSESEELLRDTLSKYTKVLGKKHPSTLSTEIVLAELLNAQLRFI